MSEIRILPAPLAPPLPFLPRPRRPPWASLLERAAGSDRIVHLAIPAPAVDPATLLRLEPDDGFAWLPPGGPQLAGLGRVAGLEGRGERRFAAVQEGAERLAPRFEVASRDGAAPEPLFFGGLSFAPGGADEPRWQGFGDASFVLPRWLYRRDGDTATLSLALRGTELATAERRRAWLAALEARRERLSGLPQLAAGPGVSLRLEAGGTAELAGRIARITAAIAAGEVEKVVMALRYEARLGAELDPLRLLRRLVLGADGSAATPFLVRRGGASFFGVSPELLVARDGDHVRSEALAGSCPRGQSLFAADDGGKNFREHAVVVEAILAALEPFCGLLEPGWTRVRHLPRVSHLATPIAGRLNAPRHLLELAAALHPTPAVGGWPRPAALDLIGELETAPRGWYAGPIGYFDHRGDGELRVALRSGLLRGQEATLFAGAGIVAGSDPTAEAAEIRAKAATVLEALGSLRGVEPVHLPFIGSGQHPLQRRAAHFAAARGGESR